MVPNTTKIVLFAEKKHNFALSVYYILKYEAFCRQIIPSSFVGVQFTFENWTFPIGAYSFGVSKCNTAIGEYSFGVSKCNAAIEEYSFGVSKCNAAVGVYCFGVSKCNAAVGAYSFDVSKYNAAVGAYSFGVSKYNAAVGAYSFDAPKCNAAIGAYSFGVSKYNAAVGEYSFDTPKYNAPKKQAPPYFGRGLLRSESLIIRSFIELHQDAEHLAGSICPSFEGLLSLFGLDDATDEGLHLHLCVVHIIQHGTEVIGRSIA